MQVVVAIVGFARGAGRRLGQAVLWWQSLPKAIRYGAYALPLLVLGIYCTQLFWPRSIQFAYAQQACLASPTLLPGAAQIQEGAQFTASMQPSVTIAGKVLYSHTTCVSAQNAPQPGSTDAIHVKPLAMVPFAKKIIVAPDDTPQVRYASAHDKPVPSRGVMTLELSKPDEIFAYHLRANDHDVACDKKDLVLRCDMTGLELAQTTQYTFQIARYFNAKHAGGEPALQLDLKTVEPVSVIDTSVKPGHVIYDKPTNLTVNLNKPAKSKSITLSKLDNERRTAIAADISYAESTVILTWKEPLPRGADVELYIADLTADDGGLISAPYTLRFTTSAGPKVADRNFGTSKQETAPRLTLTFDTNLSPKQDTAPFIKLVGADGQAIPASITKSGRTVTIRPNEALPRCYAFSVRVLDGLENEFGVSGGSAATYTSRTLCQQTTTVGTSVQGRGITAYSFGSGAKPILFFGGTHGNEKSSVYILQDFVNYLEENPGMIPAERTVVIVPNINPDGHAANTRINANGVDLNRNFPANNWKSSVKLPDQTVLPSGGGIESLSEPESKAIAAYATSKPFDLIVSYHARGSIVVPNDSGDSVGVAHGYAKDSPVSYLANAQSGDFFDYDLTGAFEDWMHDAHDKPVIVIELSNYTTREFSAHRNAILGLL